MKLGIRKIWLIFILLQSSIVAMASNSSNVIIVSNDSVSFGSKSLSIGDNLFQLFDESDYEMEAEPGGYTCFFGEDKIAVNVSESGTIVGFHFFFEFTPRFQSATEDSGYSSIYFLGLHIPMNIKLATLLERIDNHGFKYELEERSERADIQFWLPNGDTVFVSYRDKKDGCIRSIQYWR